MLSNSLVKLADRTRAEHPGIRGGAACTTCPGLGPGSGERASPRRVGKILAGPSMVGTARRRSCPPLVGHTSAPLPTLRLSERPPPYPSPFQGEGRASRSHEAWASWQECAACSTSPKKGEVGALLRAGGGSGA